MPLLRFSVSINSFYSLSLAQCLYVSILFLPLISDSAIAIFKQPKNNNMKTTTTTTAAQLFLTDYASYNNGTQFEFGHWVDLSQFSDASEFLEYIESHFAECDETSPLDSPREEIMFTDFEGFPKCFYSEGYDKETIEKLFEFINMDEEDQKIIEMYADATGYNIQNIELSDAQDAFHGTADSEAEFAERMAEECGEIPKDLPTWIENAIDWETAWNCSLCYDYMTATDENGNIYFFLNH